VGLLRSKYSIAEDEWWVLSWFGTYEVHQYQLCEFEAGIMGLKPGETSVSPFHHSLQQSVHLHDCLAYCYQHLVIDVF